MTPGSRYSDQLKYTRSPSIFALTSFSVACFEVVGVRRPPRPARPPRPLSPGAAPAPAGSSSRRLRSVIVLLLLARGRVRPGTAVARPGYEARARGPPRSARAPD